MIARIALVVLLTGASAAMATTALPTAPVSNDLWDVSNGTVVTAYSSVLSFSSAASIFGGVTTPYWGDAPNTLFADMPEGYVHYVEWATSSTVTVRSFNLFAANDGPASNYRRSFEQFNLYDWNGSAWQEIYSQQMTLPYNTISDAGLVLQAVIPTTTSNRFRAEFLQGPMAYASGDWPAGYYGPRVMELDGFSYTPDPVPEPLTLAAVGMGLAGLGGYIRRRRLAAK